jgi:hypothetical protein
MVDSIGPSELRTPSNNFRGELLCSTDSSDVRALSLGQSCPRNMKRGEGDSVEGADDGEDETGVLGSDR